MAGEPGNAMSDRGKVRRRCAREEQAKGSEVRLLLDCHITKATLPALRKKVPSLEAQHLALWRGGAFLRSSDEDILAACHQERRALVTFDQRTIPDLLRQWAAEDRPHSGVIFGDQNTVKPNRPGAVA